MSIASFFAAYGEARFRRREESVVLRALRSGAPVVALGGGSLGSQAVREALAEHTVVWLQVSPETAWERAVGGDRPLAADRDAFFALHAEREPVYAAAADAFLPEGDRGLVARALPALRALGAAPPGTKLVWAHSAGGEYPVYVGRGIAGSVLPGADGGRGVPRHRRERRPAVRGAHARRRSTRSRSRRARSTRRSPPRRRLARARARGDGPRRSRRRARAAASSATSPASAPRPTSAAWRSCRCRRRSSRRSTPRTAARPASTCRGEELRRRLPPAVGRRHRRRHARHAAAGRGSRPATRRSSRPR